jgi:hypothetical protein
MLTQEQIAALRAPFPAEALKPDTSRGFELTSIKAAYVIERLNDVFGPCGIGWRYVHSPFEDVPSDDGRLEVVTEVAFQYRLPEGEAGCGRVIWNNGWQYGADGGWSEPIFACGGKGLGRGGAPYTDARKSAVTDGLTKAASMIGVGHQVFKGLVRVSGVETGGNGRGHRSNPSTGPSATTFWSLYNEQAKPLGIPVSKAKELAGNGDWAEACNKLRALIAEAK